jgi:hypothetical protein
MAMDILLLFFKLTGVLPVLEGSGHHSANKSVNLDHGIMEIGIICSNLIENSHYSSNPGQNHVPGYYI